MRHRHPVVVLILGALLTGCSRGGQSSTAQTAPFVASTSLQAIPLGNPPGEPGTAASGIANPFEGQPAAVAEGKRLFGAMNCVYCHGAGASGLMGPALDAHGWRYGGTPAQIFNSIHDGRPKGMPAWGNSLPADQIWQIVAYLESLGGATAPGAAAPSQGAPEPSATGPQAADQNPTDSAEQGRKAGNAERTP